MERRQDRPLVAVLERHRLHVGGGVDHAEPDAVHAPARRRTTANAGASAITGTPPRSASRPVRSSTALSRALGHASRRAASPTPASSTIISSRTDSLDSRESPLVLQSGSRVVRLMNTRPWVKKPAAAANRAAEGRCHLGSPSRHGVTLDLRGPAAPRLATCRTRTRPTTPLTSSGWSGTARPSGAATGKHTSTTDLPLTEDGVRVATTLRDRLAGVELRPGADQPPPAGPSYRRAGRLPRRRGRRRPGRVGLRRLRGHHHAEIRETVPGWTVWTHPSPGGETAEQVADRLDRVVARVRDAGRPRAWSFGHGHALGR